MNEVKKISITLLNMIRQWISPAMRPAFPSCHLISQSSNQNQLVVQARKYQPVLQLYVFYPQELMAKRRMVIEWFKAISLSSVN